MTFERGTSAAWLHDLLKPHVSPVLWSCDPRERDALLKDGSKSDQIDARKLAEYYAATNSIPLYHGEHRVRTLKELGTQLSDAHERCHTSDESDQSAVPKLGHSL